MLTAAAVAAGGGGVVVVVVEVAAGGGSSSRRRRRVQRQEPCCEHLPVQDNRAPIGRLRPPRDADTLGSLSYSLTVATSRL